MRTKSNRLASTIELLEPRIAPATIIRSGASLFISEHLGGLTVATTATPGQINVTDGSGTVGFTGIVGKIVVTGHSDGSTPNDFISIIANASPFKGSVIINSGLGDDTIGLSGTINGALTINPGLGSDTIGLSDADVKIGKSLTVKDVGGGTLLFDMNDRDLEVSGAMTLIGLNVFDMGLANTLKVAKALTIATSPVTTSPLTVIFSGTQTMVGDLKITGSNGDDTLNLSGTINGSAIINTGLGDDAIVFTNQDVTVGKSFTLKDTGGATLVLDLNDRDFTVGGALTLSGITTFDMGAANSLKVAKSLTITAPPAALSPSSTLFTGTETIIGGDLKITTGATNDAVNISSRLSVTGSVLAKLGQGNNTFVMTPATGGTGIDRAFTYTGLDGVDVVVFGAASAVGGTATVSLGNGINTFVDTPTSLYQKDLILKAGFNTSTFVVTGHLDGNFSASLAANGAGNTTVFTGSVGVGKKINYTSGNGGTLEVLTLAPAAAAILNLNVSFGKGASTLNLGANASLTGKVIGHGGAYTFNQGTAILLPTLKLINYPS